MVGTACYIRDVPRASVLLRNPNHCWMVQIHYDFSLTYNKQNAFFRYFFVAFNYIVSLCLVPGSKWIFYSFYEVSEWNNPVEYLACVACIKAPSAATASCKYNLPNAHYQLTRFKYISGNIVVVTKVFFRVSTFSRVLCVTLTSKCFVVLRRTRKTSKL